MANGKCDICGRPATTRVRAPVNGQVRDMELCDQHYREMVRRSGHSASPLESLFGRRSLFDEFFGETTTAAAPRKHALRSVAPIFLGSDTSSRKIITSLPRAASASVSAPAASEM